MCCLIQTNMCPQQSTSPEVPRRDKQVSALPSTAHYEARVICTVAERQQVTMLMHRLPMPTHVTKQTAVHRSFDVCRAERGTWHPGVRTWIPERVLDDYEMLCRTVSHALNTPHALQRFSRTLL